MRVCVYACERVSRLAPFAQTTRLCMWQAEVRIVDCLRIDSRKSRFKKASKQAQCHGGSKSSDGGEHHVLLVLARAASQRAAAVAAAATTASSGGVVSKAACVLRRVHVPAGRPAARLLRRRFSAKKNNASEKREWKRALLAREAMLDERVYVARVNTYHTH